MLTDWLDGLLTTLDPLFTCVPDAHVAYEDARSGPRVVYVVPGVGAVGVGAVGVGAVGVGAVGVGAVGVGAVGVGAVGVGAVGVGAVGVGVLHPRPV